MTPAQDLDAIAAHYDLGERHGLHAALTTAAELLTGPDADDTARQILADLADGDPALWELCPEPPHIHSEAFADGFAAGWSAQLHRQAQLHLAICADLDTVPH